MLSYKVVASAYYEYNFQGDVYSWNPEFAD